MTRALVIGALIAAAPKPGAAQIERTEVVNVRFEGNVSFPDDSLARAITTRASECRSVIFTPFCWANADFAVRREYLSRREVPENRLRLQLYYQRRGFREAAIDTAVVITDEGDARVSFFVDEGEPIRVRSIDFVGLDTFEPRVTQNLPLRRGDRLSQVALDASRDSLVQRLANRGYAHVEVLVNNIQPFDAPYQADVTFDVEAGPQVRYGPIEIGGNEKLSDATILKTVQFREGDLYRRSQLIEAQARLFGLDIIRSASVVTLPDAAAADSVLPIRVAVSEGDAYRLRYGAGLTDAECFDAEARWTARNFLGGGRILRARARTANIFAQQFRPILCPNAGREEFAKLNWLASIDFLQPWIFSTRNSFSASLFGERQSLPDVYVREAIGLEVALTRAIGPRTPLTLSYRPEFSRLDAAELLFCTGFLVCTPADIAVLEGTNRIAPVGLNFTRNLANNILNPTAGYSVVIDLEHAASWTGSEFRFDRVAAEAAWYERVSGDVVIAARARGGWVGAGAFSPLSRAAGADVVHPQKRFYAGGANSVRGFAQSRLGPGVLQVFDPVRLLRSVASGGAGCAPEALLDLSCDASVLGENSFIPRPTGGTRVLEGNFEVRVDLGRSFEGVAFADVGQVWAGQESVELADLQLTPGLGIRYLSPIGPLRVDVGYRVESGRRFPVVTRQIRPFDPRIDADSDRLSVGGEFIPWVRDETLAILMPQVLFGESPSFSLSRFQLHISIGQAF